MKKVYIFLSIAIFISCSDDNAAIDQSNESLIEIAPEGLRLKTKNGMYLENYYYHSNGFVDSIHKTYQYGSPTTISEKYMYNEYNQLTQIKVVSQWPNDPQSLTTKTHQFTYNNQNQITIETVSNENNDVVLSYNYSYNAQNDLISEGIVYQNGQILSESIENYQNVYNYNTNINPFFIIYPSAYKKLRQISVNDVVQKTISNDLDTIIQSHSIEYNTNGFKIKEQIENAYPDTEDYIIYTYY